MTRHLERKTLRRCWLVGLALLIAFALLPMPRGGGSVNTALAVAPFYALIAYAVTTTVAFFTRRALVVVDLIRIACWTAFAAGCGVKDMAVSYYPFLWPQHSISAEAVGNALSGLSLLVILVVSVLYPPPKRYPAKNCAQCGFDLTGNVSGVCPECGASP